MKFPLLVKKLINHNRKRIGLLCVFALPTCIIGQTHAYIPFPDSNAIWIEYVVDEFGNFVSGSQFYVQDDTIINNLKYNKIFQTSDSNLPYIHHHWKFAYRNDTTNRKVYLYDDQSQKDQLLYDFSLIEGDTFLLYSYGGTSRYGGSIIKNIDTLTIQGNQHLIFYPEYQGDMRLPYVEGIGSLAGIINDSYLFEGGKLLKCFKKGDKLMTYFNRGPGSCELYHNDHIGIENKHQKEKLLGISPNPIVHQSVLRSKSGQSISEISIYDVTGSLQFKNSGLSNSTFPIGQFLQKKGYYFVKVRLDNSSEHTIKVIVL